MRSRTPKVLHDLAAGRWSTGRSPPRSRPGPARSWSSAGPTARSRPAAATASSSPSSREPDGTGGAVLAAAEHLGHRRAGPRALRRRAARHRRGDRRAARRTTRRRRRGHDGLDGARRPRAATAASSAAPTARSSAWSRPSAGRRDAREELAISEVNTGVYAFDGARAARGAARASAPTTPRASTTCPTVLAVLRARRRARRARTRSTTPRSLLGVNDRVDLARVRALAQRRIHEAHMRAGVTIVDPATTRIDVGVAIGAGHRHRAVDPPARRDDGRRALQHRPDDHADRQRAPRRASRSCTPT